MKANRRLRPLFVLTTAALTTLAASCSDTRVIPPPAPSPTQQPAPPPPPSPPPQAARDWREAPITPGDWNWGMEGGQSVARFAGGVLVLRCDPSGGTVTLVRAGAATRPVPITVTTTSGVHALTASPASGAIAAAIPARAPVLDAMIFSRGRFALEAQGLPPLYVPSWPELSRVAEDCRP